jgi:hypothetical protein
MTNDYQWMLNNGIAVVVMGFFMFVIWRVLVGTKSTGYQGLLIKWANNLSRNITTHAKEATQEFDRATTERGAQISALQLLVESQNPPIGAAFIAAKAVHTTADNVDLLLKEVHSAKAAMMEITKMCRLVATNFPKEQMDIEKHCNEIERIVGKGNNT